MGVFLVDSDGLCITCGDAFLHVDDCPMFPTTSFVCIFACGLAGGSMTWTILLVQNPSSPRWLGLMTMMASFSMSTASCRLTVLWSTPKCFAAASWDS